MSDFERLYNFDSDGDGISDAYGEAHDTDGDGVADTWLVDYDDDGIEDVIYEDHDGDAIMDTADFDMDGTADSYMSYEDYDGDGVADQISFVTDTDLDGELDVNEIYTDTDGDGEFDNARYLFDSDGDGVYETALEMVDTDSDGYFDVISSGFDFNADGQMDAFYENYDVDADGEFDSSSISGLVDLDGDGVKDTYIQAIDEDMDGMFDAVDFYEYDAENGTLELIPLDFFDDGSGYVPVDYENFDPENYNAEDINGNPAEDVDEWEYQGTTNRCALYSQKFVIEQLTGEEIDIDEMAAVAEENGWFTEECGTPVVNMNSMLDYYGIENEMTYGNGMDDIEACLDNGGKVIVSVDSGEIWYGEEEEIFSPADGADHAVEVIGIDNSDPENPMVILNDSGTPDGCGMMVPLDVFEGAWEDGNCQMITC